MDTDQRFSLQTSYPKCHMQIVPTQNTPALIGYYTGVFSLIPCFALILGPIACILGVIKKSEEDPEVSGTAHS